MIIYKYELEITDNQMINTGKSRAYPISVAEQQGKLVMWAILTDDIKHTGGNQYVMSVHIVGTGNRFHALTGNYGTFIGTVVMTNGLVWHIFAEPLVVGV